MGFNSAFKGLMQVQKSHLVIEKKTAPPFVFYLTMLIVTATTGA